MKRKNDNSTIDRQPILICIMTIYIFAVLYITLFDRNIGEHRAKLQPLWEIKMFMTGQDYKYWAGQIVGNLVMLLPLGFLLPIMSDYFKDGRRTVLTGLGFSLFIELTQYVTGRGLCETDDILHNTTGTILGFILYRKALNYYYSKIPE